MGYRLNTLKASGFADANDVRASLARLPATGFRRLSRRITPAVVAVAALGVCIQTAVAQPAGQPLLDSAKSGDGERVVALLGLGASVDAAEPDGTTALHWAAYRSDAAALEALLDAGADPTSTTRLGVTPLSLAATLGRPEILRPLLEAGADPNQTTGEGETPLMTVARAGNAAGIEVLLAQGAEVDAVEGWRAQTALM